MPLPRRRAARIALGTAATIVVLLVLAQLLLPGLAAQRVRDELARYGVVHSATVSAFPAIELLWGHAQSVRVSAGDLNMETSEANAILAKSRGVEQVEMEAEGMRLGPITLHGVSMRKRGSALYIQGSAGSSDFQGVLPAGVEVQPLGSVPGGVEVRVSGGLFGIEGSVDGLLSVQEGKLVAQPQGVPFAGFVKLTLFSDSAVTLSNFDLTRLASTGSDPRYLIRAWAKLN
jgi:hypothetical protein